MKPTQEQVIAWAREAGIEFSQHLNQFNTPYCDGVHMDEFEIVIAIAYEAGRESAKLDSIHTCHDQCQRPSCIAVREAYEAGCKDETNRIVNLMMIQHEAAKERHNYWHCAANLIQAEVASDT